MRPLWLLGAYHKTGCILAIKLLNLLSGGYVRVQGSLPAPPQQRQHDPPKHPPMIDSPPDSSSLATNTLTQGLLGSRPSTRPSSLFEAGLRK